MILVGGAATAASIYVLAKGTSTGGTGVTDTTSSPHYPLGFSLLGGGLGLVIGGIVMYLLQER